MEIKELLDHSAVFNLREKDKAHVLQEISRHSAALLGIEAYAVLQALEKREELGSTGIGAGIALPHARLGGVKAPFGLFARLKPAVPFDAVDEQPVDLAFLVLIPETSANLQPLACVARRLRNSQLTAKLRTAKSTETLYYLLTDTT